MAEHREIGSTNYPYLPIRVEIRGRSDESYALIDTGYTGSLVIPANWLEYGVGLPDGRSRLQLGDNSIVPSAPAYLGTLEIADLIKDG